jgi:hypothetical protein
VRTQLDKVSVLKIDKDCIISRDWLNDWVRIVVIPTVKSYALTVLSIAVGPSQHKGFHAYVKIRPPVHPELANRIQFLLGDDCHRVSLNRARIWAGLNEWDKLFEPMKTKPKVVYRLNLKRLWNTQHRLQSPSSSLYLLG